MALMAAQGEIYPMPDAAIFADTQAEPKSVYDWLGWLEEQLPFPVHRVSHGSLTEAAATMRRSQKGNLYPKIDIPLFTQNHDGKLGMVRRRSCTLNYKIKPIRRKMKELAGIRHKQPVPLVTQWIGISWDEVERMKFSDVRWLQTRWPLVEMKMTRKGCKQWMADNGYPEPPRSSCVYCPYHNDDEWRRLKTEEPEEFAKAVQFEKTIQKARKSPRFKTTYFLHKARVPLSQVDLSTDVERGQQVNNFINECEGVCGV